MPHRYFTTEISDGTATLRGADAHHLARVMRARLGDTVILCDGNAVEYTATITGFGDECVEFRVEPGYPSAAEPSAGHQLADTLHTAEPGRTVFDEQAVDGICLFQRIADLVRVALGLQRQHLRFGLPADAALGCAGNDLIKLKCF